MKNKYVIVRASSAGVFAGTLVSYKAGEATLKNARRIWYWSGAASLSQLAVDGTSRPDACKFPAAVPSILVAGVVEVIPTTPKARQSIEGVKVWSV